MLNQFFRAARARDNATLAMMSAVTFDPREQGAVERLRASPASAKSDGRRSTSRR